MPRIAEQSMEQRMEKVWLYVKRHPNGVTEKEIADDTGIGRKTVNNYLRQMKDDGKVEKDGRLWYLGDYEEVRSLKFEITPEVAYTYYLGSRLLVKQHDKRNELAETALMELADELAAHRLVGNEIAQAAKELAQRPSDPGYEKIFQTMVSCYLKRKPVRVRYKPLNGKPFDTVFKTYLIEPSAIGYATYVIGDSSLQGELRSYKLERIQAASPEGEQYKVPDSFPGLEILKNSWSIIIGDKTQRIKLKFSPNVKDRVLETQWHPSQDDDHDEKKSKKDDWLTWWVDVVDTTDMIPWIRSWGADVEVIEPLGLRDKMAGEFKAAAERYGWHVSFSHSDRPSLDDTFAEVFGDI